MDLNHVAVFVRVVEAGSFTAAGESLGLPKSSVSRTVARLEEDLGVRLLQRTTRSLHLTDTGRTYYERARNAIASLDEAAGVASDEGTVPRGVVRMTAPGGFGGNELAEVLVEFARRYPEIHVELALTGRYVDLVEEGFDIALRGGKLEDSSLIAKRLGKTDFGLFAAPRYLEERGTPTSLDDLAAHACVLHHARGGRAEWTLTDEAGVATTLDVRGAISVDETDFVRQAVEAGAGIGLLPLMVAAKCAAAGFGNRLVRVLPAYARRGGAIHVVTPPLENLPRRARLLRDFLIERLTPLYSYGAS